MVVLLKVMWATAKTWGYANTNPFDGLKMPTKKKAATYNFTVEEALAIIHEAKGWYKLFFRILAETGMRPGELAGLRVCDVSPRSLRIAQSVWNQKIQTPKTDQSIRQFAISTDLGEQVAAYIRETGRTDLVFLNSRGKPLHIGVLQTEVLSPILERLGIREKVEAMGIKKVGQYAFRHMNVTELERQGVPLKTIQKRVGHAIGSEVTEQHYLHAVDADDLRAAELMGAMFTTAKGPTQ
jgi:integrase